MNLNCEIVAPKEVSKIQGPCEPNEWLVLNANAPAGVQCEKRHCPTGYVSYGGRCNQLGSKESCTYDLVLSADPFGRGVCDCPEWHLWYPPNRKCYLELSRGPCPEDMYFGTSMYAEKAECLQLTPELEAYIAQNPVLRELLGENEEKILLKTVINLPVLEKMCPTGHSRNLAGECRAVERTNYNRRRRRSKRGRALTGRRLVLFLRRRLL